MLVCFISIANFKLSTEWIKSINGQCIFTLLVCRFPTMCHWMSLGFFLFSISSVLYFSTKTVDRHHIPFNFIHVDLVLEIAIIILPFGINDFCYILQLVIFAIGCEIFVKYKPKIILSVFFIVINFLCAKT